MDLPFFQSSGVKIDPQCKKDYDDLHDRKVYRYLIFRISEDDTTIIVEKKAPNSAQYSEFVEVSNSSILVANRNTASGVVRGGGGGGGTIWGKKWGKSPETGLAIGP